MVRRKCKYDFRFDLSLQIQCTYLHTYIVLQGRRKWVGKVGPGLGRSVNPIAIRGGRFCPAVLLTHPAWGSFLRPCQLYTAFCSEVIYQWMYFSISRGLLSKLQTDKYWPNQVVKNENCFVETSSIYLNICPPRPREV